MNRADPTAAASGASTRKPFRPGIGLSWRLLFLTIVFVMMAEVLIYVPSIANYRNNWLQDRLTSAQTAALVLEAAPADMIPEGLVDELLKSVGAKAIAMKIHDTRRLLARSGQELPMARRAYDLREMHPVGSVLDSFDTLFFGGGRPVRVIGAAPMGGDFVEIVISDTPLRDAMLRFSGNILLLSLFISGLTAMLVYIALSMMIVKPVRRLADNIMHFGARPDDATRIIEPSGRKDEIGQAEVELESMQRTLVQQLRQREHLAQLGLAVSKINHDLRNMLASAQLLSDRLAEIAEPSVQRFAPKLIGALGRAISFCESTLAYGRVQEKPPEPRPVQIADLVEEVRSLLPHAEQIRWQADLPANLVADIDPDYLFRILLNLGRNAVHAMAPDPEQPVSPGAGITVSGRREADTLVIRMADTGPGVPTMMRTRLFEAFQGSGRAGSTGLGLAIASDLARGHGGSVVLVDEGPGATFEIRMTCARPRRNGARS